MTIKITNNTKINTSSIFSNQKNFKKYQKLEKSSLNFSETEVQVRMRKTILANHSLKH